MNTEREIEMETTTTTTTTEKWGVFSDEDLRIIAKALAAYSDEDLRIIAKPGYRIAGTLAACALKQARGGSPRAEELFIKIIEFFINAGRKTP